MTTLKSLIQDAGIAYYNNERNIQVALHIIHKRVRELVPTSRNVVYALLMHDKPEEVFLLTLDKLEESGL